MQKAIESKQFEKEIEKINLSHNSKFSAYYDIINLCIARLHKQRKEVVCAEFSNSNKEIKFFREIKQIPLSNLIYYTELRLFEAKFPKANVKCQKKYIMKQIKRLNEFFKKNYEFINYIESGEHNRDHEYFYRGHRKNFLRSMDYVYHFDSEFNTSHDNLLGKVLAFQKMIIYLQKRLNSIVGNPIEKGNGLNWTASKISLTELIYALHQSNSINNGQAEIKQIAKVFENMFNYDLGDFYRIYTEIRRRKKSRTKFLDELSISMINKLEIDDN